MRIVFRTDASRTIGTGHVMRCLTLASALRERGATVSFICREHVGHLCDLIERQGFVVDRLSSDKNGYPAEDSLAHSSWLGSSWQEDAKLSRSIIKAINTKLNWLIVDHYSLDHRWEKDLRPFADQIMAIDDLADRVHDCDLLLDQNLVEAMHTRYVDKVPASCRLLLGPKYALLQPIYAELYDRISPRKGPVRRIFIYFGGADPDNLTGLALTAFLSLGRTDVEVDVVLANGDSHAHTTRSLAQKHSNIHIHSNLPSLAPLIAKADLAIGATGATIWERLCLGLPTLAVTLAENQRSVTQNLQHQKFVEWIGHKDQVNQQKIAQTLKQFLSGESLSEWSNRCRNVCDGQGTDHVARLIMPASEEKPVDWSEKTSNLTNPS